jgi:hypothetical protein
VSAGDALVKLSAVFPWLGDSEVALEMAGFTAPQIVRLLSDKRRAGSADVLQAIAAAQTQTAAPAPVPGAPVAAPVDNVG